MNGTYLFSMVWSFPRHKFSSLGSWSQTRSGDDIDTGVTNGIGAGDAAVVKFM